MNISYDQKYHNDKFGKESRVIVSWERLLVPINSGNKQNCNVKHK